MTDDERMHQVAIAALQIAASDVVGPDPVEQVEKIAEWIKRAEDETEPVTQ